MVKTLRKPAHQARLRRPPPQSTESPHGGQIRADRRDDRHVALWAVGRKLARLQQRCRGEKGSAGLPSFSRSVAPDTKAVVMRSRASNSDRKAKAVMPAGRVRRPRDRIPCARQHSPDSGSWRRFRPRKRWRAVPPGKHSSRVSPSCSRKAPSSGRRMCAAILVIDAVFLRVGLSDVYLPNAVEAWDGRSRADGGSHELVAVPVLSGSGRCFADSFSQSRWYRNEMASNNPPRIMKLTMRYPLSSC